MPSVADDGRAARILRGVRAIPEGYVRTYGDLSPGAPRLAGRVLSEHGAGVPWHRVVRADGSLAQGARQEALLRAEGVPIRPSGRVDLRAARLPLPPGEHLE
ncbi:MGMT family protein [Patulibacter sp. NPDC049589]|uniref:MGMT family protein n=1 Tax=Patulibacter sp. NPDC049589 TaxID=3154731 RepID=UPI00341AAA32